MTDKLAIKIAERALQRRGDDEDRYEKGDPDRVETI